MIQLNYMALDQCQTGGLGHRVYRKCIDKHDILLVSKQSQVLQKNCTILLVHST